MGFIDTIFGGKDEVKFKTIPQTAEATEARRRQADIAFGAPPELPTREIVTEQAPTSLLARETATELAQPTNILDQPEVQGVIQQAIEQGNILLNRLGRGLQKTGSFSTTTGRDVLGRAVSSVQANIAAALAPFIEAQRSRRERLIGTLESLGVTDRGITQAQKDAEFQQKFLTSQQLQTFTLPALRDVINLQPGQLGFIEPGRTGILEQLGQVADLSGKVIKAISGGGGGGGTSGASATGFISPTGGPQGG